MFNRVGRLNRKEFWKVFALSNVFLFVLIGSLRFQVQAVDKKQLQFQEYTFTFSRNVGEMQKWFVVSQVLPLGAKFFVIPIFFALFVKDILDKGIKNRKSWCLRVKRSNQWERLSYDLEFLIVSFFMSGSCLIYYAIYIQYILMISSPP